MPDDALLTPAEIVTLTGKRRYRAQVRALGKMGVRHVVRPDGSPVVARAIVAALLGRYTEQAPAPARDAWQPNVASLRKRHSKRHRPDRS